MNTSQSLRERIHTWSAEHAADFPPEVLQIFANKTEEVLKSKILSGSIQEGDTAPDFELPDTGGESIRLHEKAKNGPVILSFYRGTWCPYCTIEFQALLESMPEFREHGASVLTISPQVRERYENPTLPDFSDLCDEGNHVGRSFGLVYPLGDQIRNIYTKFGIRLEDLNLEDSYEVPIPATYIIDRDLKIRYANANADITDRAEPAVLVDQLTKLAA